MKVLVTVKLKQLIDELKAQYPEVEFVERSVSEITMEDEDADVLMATNAGIDFGRFKQLSWVMWYSAGVNNLPLDYFNEQGIILTNARGVHKVQIAEFIFAYIMADYKQLHELMVLQQKHGYQTNIRTTELFNKTICFLGTGEIAGNAARLAAAFQMKTIGINTDGRAVEHFDRTYKLEERAEAFKVADIIVNVLPETEKTVNLLQRADFEKMGSDALFINVGRGTVVDESVLLEVLKNRVIRRAALDVYYKEPLSEDNELYRLDNVMMTPHITGLSSQYNERATEIFSYNLKQLIQGNMDFKNIVDYDKGY